MQFLNVKTPFAFNRIFGSEQSKEILIGFLNAIIDFEDNCKITDLTIVDPDKIPFINGLKDSYFNARTILSNGAKVIIEIQVLNYEGIEKQFIENAAKLYSTQLNKAKSCEKKESIIVLTIIDYIIFEEFENVISYFKIVEKQAILDCDYDIYLVFLELPKFKKKEQELEIITEKWIFFVKNVEQLDCIPKSFKEPNLLKAFEIANTAYLSEKEQEFQFKQEDFIYLLKGAWEQARTDGIRAGREDVLKKNRKNGLRKIKNEWIKRGQEEREIEIAKKLLLQGFDVKMVSLSTDLDEKIVIKLKQQVDKQ